MAGGERETVRYVQYQQRSYDPHLIYKTPITHHSELNIFSTFSHPVTTRWLRHPLRECTLVGTPSSSFTSNGQRLMTWTKYSTARPRKEGWYLVGYSKEGGGNYWLGWAYEALYWHPDVAVWTDDARHPQAGGEVVKLSVELWTEILCLEEAPQD